MSTEQHDAAPSFSELGLAPAILEAVQQAGYETPSPIQAQSIPPLLTGRDLLGQAQTGTGKTAAFSLPLLSRLDLKSKATQLLVLAPTRELAIQVSEAMQSYARHLKDFHILPIYGGQSVGIQLRALKRQPQVIVGTPGRILDHIRRRTLKLDQLQALVLDEADEMLRMGFIDDVETILQQTPDSRQVALFSATMPGPIHRVAQKYLKDPVEVRIKSNTSTVETINQRYWQVTGLHKLDALTRILEVENFDGMIIFVRTKNATVELAEKLEARGYSASAINGDMNQALREKTIERMKKGQIDILIATDVAARGLDIERMSHVVNYDIPYDTESYVHRIGRTGRAGRQGEAILFVSPREKRMLAAIEKATRQTITRMQLPSTEEIADRRVIQFMETLTETIESQDLSYFENLMQRYQQEHNADPMDMAAALTYLLQKDRPLNPPVKHVSERKPRENANERQFNDERLPRRERRKDFRADDRHPTDPDMDIYRAEVGRVDNVEPRNLVGAIANEAGIESRFIGRITINEDHSLINLPQGMPKDIFQHLRKVWVANKQLNLSLANDEIDNSPAPIRPKLNKARGAGRALNAGNRPKQRTSKKR
ncbi:Cold-shock DEAD-box protein A [Methylophaga frappieri]|uniref:ATP-dependent RNA helicase DeaD n=1 Tax=Methylophaga frappieri (strain ATCC BAA-2434 / DSM 25690 / JAM7) TaxID=754477 RepID=I1YGH9_METFJ|nr:DEAD/DEAH box helicase [Methylophaga frappieri]AFJ02022.1 Cold-shock DEAD-box protein A [Methylophaga frappieri]